MKQSIKYMLVAVSLVCLSAAGTCLLSQQRAARRKVSKSFSYPAASETVQIEIPGAVRALSGIVELSNGGGISDVLVERVKADWTTRVDAGFSHSNGRFALLLVPPGTYYLKLSKAEFCTVRLKVRVKKNSRERLYVQLPLGI